MKFLLNSQVGLNVAKLSFCLAIILLSSSTILPQKKNLPPVQAREITIVSEPNAVVWLDNIRRGSTDEAGKLTIKSVSAGKHTLRLRADGFKEISQNLLPTQKGDLKIALVKTADEAELAFQQAEKLTSSSREKAVEMYEKAIALRPNYPEALLGLARVHSDQSNFDKALEAVKKARKFRPGYAEASAVEGRIYVSEGNDEKAVATFKRAITEGKGFQPEAHTGLGLFYKDKAEGFASEGDFENEKANYLIAAGHLKTAVSQLAGAPDAIVIYQFLGLVYEQMKDFEKAIAVYEDFLRVFPDSSETTAVRSFIEQLKKQMKNENL
ncbi:MAG: tetratricopeptide repeat protein [Acidobacteria bacterium]|nr:tetratricopeptide repeat protein [Acidobacteriota bacterium]